MELKKTFPPFDSEFRVDLENGKISLRRVIIGLISCELADKDDIRVTDLRKKPLNGNSIGWWKREPKGPISTLEFRRDSPVERRMKKDLPKDYRPLPREGQFSSA